MIFPVRLTCLYALYPGSQECAALRCFVPQNSINAKFFLGLGNWLIAQAISMLIEIVRAACQIANKPNEILQLTEVDQKFILLSSYKNFYKQQLVQKNLCEILFQEVITELAAKMVIPPVSEPQDLRTLEPSAAVVSTLLETVASSNDSPAIESIALQDRAQTTSAASLGT